LRGGNPLNSVTIDNVDAETMAGLRARAARNGRSVEDEAREILYRALGRAEAPRDLSAAFRTWFNPEARADMALPPREPIPDPPSFD